MRRILLLSTTVALCIILLLIWKPQQIYAEELFEELTDSGEYKELNQVVRDMLGQEQFDFSDYVEGVLTGEQKLSLKELGHQALQSLSGQFSSLRSLFVQLLGIVLFTAVFTSFAKAFKNAQVAESGFYVAYLLLFSVLSTGYLTVNGLVSETLEKLFSFMKVLIPVFAASLALAAGALTSQTAAATLLMLLTLADYFLFTVLLPIVHVYMMAVLANHLTEEEPLSKLTELLARGIHMTLKAMMGAVAGISILQTMITPAIDKAKRSTVLHFSELLPGLGTLFGGVTDTVFQAGTIIKNAIGSGGMVVIILICLLPLCRVLLYLLCCRAGMAVVQPIADKRILNCLSDTAEGITMQFQILAAGAILFLLMMAILVRATT